MYFNATEKKLDRLFLTASLDELTTKYKIYVDKKKYMAKIPLGGRATAFMSLRINKEPGGGLLFIFYSLREGESF